MKKNITKWHVCLIVILVAMVLSSCSSSKPSSTSSAGTSSTGANPTSTSTQSGSAGQKKSISGTLTYFEPHYNDPSVKQAVDKTIEMFQKKYPDVKFDIQYVPMADRTAKFIAAMEAHTGPDIACIGSMSDYYQFAKAGYLRPITPFLDNPNEYWSRFPSSFVNYITINNEIYGIPYYSGPYAMFYNIRLYKEAGIEKMPTTWDEFYNDMALLTKDTNGDGLIDQYGLTIPTLRETAPRIFLMMCWSNGGAVTADDMTTVTINSPECVEALEYLNSLVQAGFVPPGIGEADNDVINEYFGKEIAATRFEGNWSLASIPATYPNMKDNLGVYPLPRFDNKEPISLSILAVYGITVQSKNPDAAFAFADFITSDEAQQAYLDIAGYGPVTKSIIEANKNDKKWGPFIQLLDHARVKPIYNNDNEVDDIIREAMQKTFLKQATAQEALDVAAKKIKEVISK